MLGEKTRREASKRSAEVAAIKQTDGGVEPLLLVLIDEVRALRQELAEYRNPPAEPPARVEGPRGRRFS